MKKYAESALGAFSSLIKAIQSAIADVKEDAKRAIDSKPDEAARLLSLNKQLGGIMARAQSLEEEFRDAMEGKPPRKVRPHLTPPPRERKKLVVHFSDGDVFDYHNAADTFVASLRKMGLGKVSSLGIILNNAPLVSKEQSKWIQQRREGDYWITTQSDTANKQRILERVAEQFGEHVTVEVVYK